MKHVKMLRTVEQRPLKEGSVYLLPANIADPLITDGHAVLLDKPKSKKRKPEHRTRGRRKKSHSDD